MEIQQRSVEYTVLFNKHNTLRPGLLEPMPQFEKPTTDDDVTPPATTGDDVTKSDLIEAAPAPVATSNPQPQVTTCSGPTTTFDWFFRVMWTCC